MIDWRERILRRIHFAAAAILAVPLVAIGLTGSILVFELQLDAWLDPPPARSATAPPQSLNAVVAAARQAAPGMAPTLIVVPATPTAAAQVALADPHQPPGPGGTRVFLDPGSLDILAVRGPDDSLLRQIFMLHANLLSHDRSGRAIVGWFGVAMCAMGLSGLVLWWPSRRNWRRAFVVERAARGRVFLRQLHGAAGIWGLAVFLTVSATGVWLSFPQTFNGLAGAWLGLHDIRPPPPAAVTPVAGVAPLDADGAAALAQAAVPGAPLYSVSLPARPDQPFRVSLLRPGTAEPQINDDRLPIVVTVDPWSRQVVAIHDPRTLGFAARAIVGMHAIHDGSGLGWPWRLLVFVVGFLPALFATTGLSMWFMKRRARRVSGALQPAPGD